MLDLDIEHRVSSIQHPHRTHAHRGHRLRHGAHRHRDWPTRKLASPGRLRTTRGGQPALDAEYFATLAKEEQIGRFVVGLPVHLHGGESQKSTEARAFGEWLGEVTGVPVEYFDERFTTAEADELLGAAKLTKKQRQARRDQLAAQIMLTAYLESGGRGQTSPSVLIDFDVTTAMTQSSSSAAAILGQRVARTLARRPADDVMAL